jgi:osmotically-inducible protein OsmY
MSSNTFNATQRDESLEQAVRDALARYAPLQMWQHSIAMQAGEGTVVLNGNVRSQAEKEIAEKLARSVKGVTSVENQLIVDGDLEVALAQALGVDARTNSAFPGILVGVVFGTAFLKGRVASEDVKKAAGEITSQVTGVQRVSNELIVLAKVAAPA